MKKKADHLLRLGSREFTREKRRLFGMFCTMLLAGLLLFCGLLSLSALLVIATWETPYRLHTLSALVVLYLAGAAFAWRHFEVLDREGDKALEKAREELDKTLQRYDQSIDPYATYYPQSITMQLLTQQPGLVVFLMTELLPSLLSKFSRRKTKRRHKDAHRDQA